MDHTNVAAVTTTCQQQKIHRHSNCPYEDKNKTHQKLERLKVLIVPAREADRVVDERGQRGDRGRGQRVGVGDHGLAHRRRVVHRRDARDGYE